MGRKHSRKGKHLLLYLAFAAVAGLISGCAKLADVGARWQTPSKLEAAENAWQGGEFSKSRDLLQEVLRDSPRSEGDRALFMIGRIEAHPGNPNSSRKRALEAFHRLLSDYPDSPYRQAATAWVETLHRYQNAENRLQELTAKNEALSRTARERSEKLSGLEVKINELTSQFQAFSVENEALKQQIEALKNQIEQLKNIDLGIQQRKRKPVR